MIVLDASAAVDLLLERLRGAWVAARIATEPSLHAPHLLDLEVASTLRKRERLGEIPAARGAAALADLSALPLTRYPTTALLSRIWQLRGTLTPYDAAYVALAEALDAPLVTTDDCLARSTGHRARIEAFPHR